MKRHQRTKFSLCLLPKVVVGTEPRSGPPELRHTTHRERPTRSSRRLNTRCAKLFLIKLTGITTFTNHIWLKSKTTQWREFLILYLPLFLLSSRYTGYSQEGIYPMVGFIFQIINVSIAWYLWKRKPVDALKKCLSVKLQTYYSPYGGHQFSHYYPGLGMLPNPAIYPYYTQYLQGSMQYPQMVQYPQPYIPQQQYGSPILSLPANVPFTTGKEENLSLFISLKSLHFPLSWRVSCGNTETITVCGEMQQVPCR